MVQDLLSWRPVCAPDPFSLAPHTPRLRPRAASSEIRTKPYEIAPPTSFVTSPVGPPRGHTAPGRTLANGRSRSVEIPDTPAMTSASFHSRPSGRWYDRWDAPHEDTLLQLPTLPQSPRQSPHQSPRQSALRQSQQIDHAAPPRDILIRMEAAPQGGGHCASKKVAATSSAPTTPRLSSTVAPPAMPGAESVVRASPVASPAAGSPTGGLCRPVDATPATWTILNGENMAASHGSPYGHSLTEVIKERGQQVEAGFKQGSLKAKARRKATDVASWWEQGGRIDTHPGDEAAQAAQ